MQNNYIISGSNITFYHGGEGKSYTVARDQKTFNEVVDAIMNDDFDLAAELANPVTRIANYTRGSIEITDGQLLYKGYPIHNSLTARILEMHAEGFKIDSLLNFLTNLMENPSNRAVNELYSFLEKGKMPITPDGYFLAYKRVREDYTDCHTGKIDNSVGQVVEMPRNLVDEDSNRTCSAGLHFCSREYLSHFWGERMIVLKIHPKDVVAIPADYNDSKGRCSRYEVVDEIESEHRLEGLVNDSYSVNDGERKMLRATTVNSLIEETDFFVSVDDASEELDIPMSYINRVLRGERKSTSGYTFEWVVVPKEDVDEDWTVEDEMDEMEELEQPFKHALSPKVRATHADTGTVRDYFSVEQAANDLDINEYYINRVLRGDRMTTGGWLFTRL